MKLSSPIPPKKARIEIIPLIDIMFFLLACFMLVSLSMTQMRGMKVRCLPRRRRRRRTRATSTRSRLTPSATSTLRRNSLLRMS